MAIAAILWTSCRELVGYRRSYPPRARGRPGYADRVRPVNVEAAKLQKRTLTNLYNERPAWFDHAHRALNEVVAAAYGWPADLSDEEVLARLFALNQERAGCSEPG